MDLVEELIVKALNNKIEYLKVQIKNEKSLKNIERNYGNVTGEINRNLRSEVKYLEEENKKHKEENTKMSNKIVDILEAKLEESNDLDAYKSWVSEYEPYGWIDDGGYDSLGNIGKIELMEIYIERELKRNAT